MRRRHSGGVVAFRGAVGVLATILMAASCTTMGGSDADSLDSGAGRAPEVLSPVEGLAIEVASEPFPEAVRDAFETVGEGVDITATELLDRPVELIFSLPESPGPDAVPVVVHRSLDGRVEVLPGVYNADDNTITVSAASLSPFWPAWIRCALSAPAFLVAACILASDPELRDNAVDTLTGRHDAPDCDVLTHGGETTTLVSDGVTVDLGGSERPTSIHFCVTANDAGGARLTIKSNRGTSQILTIRHHEAMAVTYVGDGFGLWIRELFEISLGMQDNQYLLYPGEEIHIDVDGSSEGPVVVEAHIELPTAVFNLLQLAIGSELLDEAIDLTRSQLLVFVGVFNCAAGLSEATFGANPLTDTNKYLACIWDTIEDDTLRESTIDSMYGALIARGVAARDANKLRELKSWARTAGEVLRKIGKWVDVANALAAVWDFFLDRESDRWIVNFTPAQPEDAEGAAVAATQRFDHPWEFVWPSEARHWSTDGPQDVADCQSWAPRPTGFEGEEVLALAYFLDGSSVIWAHDQGWWGMVDRAGSVRARWPHSQENFSWMMSAFWSSWHDFRGDGGCSIWHPAFYGGEFLRISEPLCYEDSDSLGARCFNVS